MREFPSYLRSIMPTKIYRILYDELLLIRFRYSYSQLIRVTILTVTEPSTCKMLADRDIMCSLPKRILKKYSLSSSQLYITSG